MLSTRLLLLNPLNAQKQWTVQRIPRLSASAMLSSKVLWDKNDKNNNLRASFSTANRQFKYDHNSLLFYVNGQRVVESDVDPRTTLAAYLRDNMRLTGTKIGCNEGGCGACTIMISDQDPASGKLRHYSANACLTPLCAVFGKSVTTVEGIGNIKKMHPVQERLSIAHGSQCGYCTPGFVMAMYSLLRNNPHPQPKEVDEAIQGNLCRCTGYRPILDAFYSFAVDSNGMLKRTEQNVCEKGEQCCKATGNTCTDDRKQLRTLSNFDNCNQYESDQEPIFPPELAAGKFAQKTLYYHNNGHSWYQPTNLQHLLALKKEKPFARIIAGNSEVGVELKFQFANVENVINAKQVPELRKHFLDEKRGAFLGSALTLSEIEKILHGHIQKLPESKTGVFRCVKDMLHWFAGKHVRNMATIAGNIATGSPISDLNPIWMATNAHVALISERKGERIIPIDENFFLGYRKTVIAQDEVISGIWIPYSNETQYCKAYKQAQRREDDIAIVTGAFMADVDPSSHIIKDIRIAYGGMAPTTKMAINTARALRGSKLDEKTFEKGIAELRKEFKLPPGVPGGMERYRQTLAHSFFLRFFTHVASKLKIPGYRLEDVESNVQSPNSGLIASQIYQDVPNSQAEIDPVGRPIMHYSGKKHTTGEAVYCDDLYPSGALYIALVQAPIASGSLDSLDFAEALKVPGVRGYIDHNDVKKGAFLGHAKDTPIFAGSKITYHCQPVAAIVADTHEAARTAASRVVIKCTPDKPIVTIEEAIAKNSYLLEKPFIVRSELAEDYGTHDAVSSDWTKYDHVVDGTIKMGGQEHFYLETQNVIVLPRECDEVSVISSTQCVNDVQVAVSEALGIPQHKVDVRVKRIGGGFGGKESSSGIFVVPAAIAAMKFRKPVKFTPERFDDMAISGTRHPYRCDYKLGVTKDGKVQNYDMTLYGNCGHTLDLSIGVMQRAIVHADNVYRFPNATIRGLLCKTNLASSTAFRGFGGPQGMFGVETMMLHAAETLGMDVNEFRKKNLYREGECTPFGMHLRRCNIRRCWDECFELSDYDARRSEVMDFNKKSKYIKRGIYVAPTKFSIGFGIKQLNQAGSLVNVYTDGSVLVSHGGMEMGQGLHTKILQITSRCLGVDISKIHINDTATDKIPNSSPTAASVGSDLNGLAVMDACNKIMAKLEPLKKANPGLSWEELVQKAYMERIPLFSSGHAIIPHETVDFFNGKGAEMFAYCVYGTACSEVEVDCLTGDNHILRTDIVMDVGDSLNPAIDIGQIEGAFIQGYGLFTMEELKIRPNGIRLTRGPGTYKIPSADDVPRQFHVKLLKGSSNDRAIFSSKAIGEPPLFLGVSAFFAIREAVKAFREERGMHGYFRFDSPATPERIRMACEDSLTEKIDKLPDQSEFVPWTVQL